MLQDTESFKSPGINLSHSELTKIIGELDKCEQVDGDYRSLSPSCGKMIRNILYTFLLVLNLLKKPGMGINVIRKFLKVNKEEPENNYSPEKDHTDADADAESNSDDMGSVNPEEDSKNPDDDQTPKEDRKKKKKKKGHGRNFEDLINNTLSSIVECYVEGLSPGDPCPEEMCSGKLSYMKNKDKRPKLVTFDSHAPFEPIIYVFSDLICKLCEKVFKASLPEDAITKGLSRENKALFTNRALASLAVEHYYLGRSFRSLSQHNYMETIPLATSTICDQAMSLESLLEEICEHHASVAAQASVFYADDVANKIISEKPEVRLSRKGNYSYRSGIYTTIITAILNGEDKKLELFSEKDKSRVLPIYKTGPKHMGENLDEFFLNRKKNLPIPTLVTDRSSCNSVTSIIVNHSGCLQHAQDRFYEARKGYPKESQKILDKFGKIFSFDRATVKMTPDKRLDYLKDNAYCILLDIKKDVNKYIEDKIAAPSDTFGKSLTYFNNNYLSLEYPFKVIGLGLTNNISEWLTYPVVRYLLNSTHHRNMKGARVGANLISLVMQALLNGRNPIKYLEYLFSNAKKFRNNPNLSLPWNTPIEEVPSLQPNWFKFWVPDPGQSPPFEAT